jgi:HD-like signal output (HDOD) protein
MTQLEEPCRNLLASSKLRPFPSVALRLMSLIQQDKISLMELGHVLETDAPLSVTVLRAANSPLFAHREIRSIPLALAVLGLDRVCLLTLTAAVLHTMPASIRRDYLRAWWRHNLATALLAKHLSPRDMVAEYSYMCGLLHSVGQLVLFEAFPVRYDNLLMEKEASGAPLLEMERSFFGADHCDLGAALLSKWNLPSEMVDTAAHYLDPEHAGGQSAGLVNFACVVADHIGFSVSPAACGPTDGLPPLVQKTLGNEKLCREITERVETIESSLAA